MKVKNGIFPYLDKKKYEIQYKHPGIRLRYLKLPIPQSTPCPFWKFTKHDKIAWNALILPDPIEAIKSKMKDAGLRNKDLVGEGWEQRIYILNLKWKETTYVRASQTLPP